MTQTRGNVYSAAVVVLVIACASWGCGTAKAQPILFYPGGVQGRLVCQGTAENLTCTMTACSLDGKRWYPPDATGMCILPK